MAAQPGDAAGEPHGSTTGPDSLNDIHSGFAVGDAVEIHGLQGAKELNGRRGHIVAFVQETARLGVMLEGGGDTKAIRPVNLHRLGRSVQAVEFEPTGTPEGCDRSCGRMGVVARQDEKVVPPEEGERQHMSEQDPDLALARLSARATFGAFACGAIASQAALCPAAWFVWSFLSVFLADMACPADYAGEWGLVALCAVLGLHSGFACSEVSLCAGRGDFDSGVPWSILVVFISFLCLYNFWVECATLPPSWVTSSSFIFHSFPLLSVAILASCAEFFLGLRYFPGYKIWSSAVALGVACMAAGQALIVASCRTAGRNFWAFYRYLPEDEEGGEAPEDFVALDVPDRRIVREGVYCWERHPVYLGAILWGAGAELVLCNPVMLFFASVVLWLTLFPVVVEEERELYDEFAGGYANYSALTCCWIPFFNTLLEEEVFQREVPKLCGDVDPDHGGAPEQEPACGTPGSSSEDHSDSDPDDGAAPAGDGDAQSEDDMLPAWEGVPRGGVLWNQQFRDPWIFPG